METTIQRPIPGQKFRFTKESAAYYAKIANERRWERERARKAREAERIAREGADPVLVPERIYQDKRIERVREHIKRLDRMLEDCIDPKEIKALADALAKFEEIERILSGRPMPGSLRPKAPKEPKTPPTSGISDEFTPA